MAAPIQIYGLKCLSCKFMAILTDSDPDFVSLPLQALTCPKCGAMSVVYMTEQGDKGAALLSVSEMRKAFTGFGLPSENDISPDNLHYLFVEVGVDSVDLETSPENRVLIRNVTFENGKTVWLAPSGLGVAALKITTGEIDGKR